MQLPFELQPRTDIEFEHCHPLIRTQAHGMRCSAVKQGARRRDDTSKTTWQKTFRIQLTRNNMQCLFDLGVFSFRVSNNLLSLLLMGFICRKESCFVVEVPCTVRKRHDMVNHVRSNVSFRFGGSYLF